MFGINTLVNNLNSAINNGTLDRKELAEAFGSIESLESGSVSFVNTEIDLPDPVNNKGRFFYIKNENRYIFSDGNRWRFSVNAATISNLYAWGNNSNFLGSGFLGDNTVVDKSSPVSVSGGFTDWVQVSAGRDASVGIRANGTLWSWGYNLAGQVGDNTSVNKSSPVSVVGGFTDWIQASAGYSHSLGVRANGTLWAWGSNAQGRLGNNTAVLSRSSPVLVVGGFTNWVQASANNQFSLGVRANGSLWAWGGNGAGQLGQNTVISRSSPVSVVGGFVDWIQASAGNVHSLGLRANGTIWAWGSNYDGQLGDNTSVNKSSPVSVVGGFTDWVQASAGKNHSIGLRANGTVWAWGYNSYGKLGDNTSVNKSSPVSVVGGFTDWVHVDAGKDHNIAVRANGTLWGWGRGQYGLLGNNFTTTRSSPVSAIGGFTDWVQGSGGNYHSIGIRG
jgi:alpha-tubulin suppressor-like RCC1 family protein